MSDPFTNNLNRNMSAMRQHTEKLSAEAKQLYMFIAMQTLIGSAPRDVMNATLAFADEVLQREGLLPQPEQATLEAIDEEYNREFNKLDEPDDPFLG